MFFDTSKVNIKNCEHYTWGEKGECDGWHFVKSIHLSVILERVPPGSAERTHYHKKAEQFFFILSGEATMVLESHELVLTAGEGVHIAAGSRHRLMNKGSEDVTFTVTSTPPSHGDRQLIDS